MCRQLLDIVKQKRRGQKSYMKDVPFSAQRLSVERWCPAVDVGRAVLARALALSFFRRFELGVLRSLDGERGGRRGGGGGGAACFRRGRARVAHRRDAVGE